MGKVFYGLCDQTREVFDGADIRPVWDEDMGRSIWNGLYVCGQSVVALATTPQIERACIELESLPILDEAMTASEARLVMLLQSGEEVTRDHALNDFVSGAIAICLRSSDPEIVREEELRLRSYVTLLGAAEASTLPLKLRDPSSIPKLTNIAAHFGGSSGVDQGHLASELQQHLED